MQRLEQRQMKNFGTLVLFTPVAILLLGATANGDPIAIDEINNSKTIGNVTDIQVGSLSLCEAAGLALDVGSCVNRTPSAETSDVVSFSITAAGDLKIDLGSDMEAGEVGAPPADSTVPQSTPDPAWSISEPNFDCEGCVQIFLYEPGVGQPGYAKDSSGAVLTYQITSDVPEPATWFLLGSASLALLGFKRLRGSC
jgi:hypothetical protein